MSGAADQQDVDQQRQASDRGVGSGTQPGDSRPVIPPLVLPPVGDGTVDAHAQPQDSARRRIVSKSRWDASTGSWIPSSRPPSRAHSVPVRRVMEEAASGDHSPRNVRPRNMEPRSAQDNMDFGDPSGDAAERYSGEGADNRDNSSSLKEATCSLLV